ncbi:hypothetical protein BKA62DRAFT_712069 [Auriculariales sp. MPI-PUGE-AT-0066]|nr:hypothetical protein BKA62DRAFT_712069 [Auriculariales sp. MPI-PUGE-AT-0066]
MNLAAGLKDPEFPARFAQLKQDITAGREAELTASWAILLDVLKQRTEQFIQQQQKFIPQVEFSELDSLSPEQLAEIKRKGTVVIHGVVSPDIALSWKEQLKTIVTENPDVQGVPEDDKQFFLLYWARPQVQARVHPNVLKVNKFLNNLYTTKTSERVISEPLAYADRFRIRKPNRPKWAFHPPHMDGGSIERWEDAGFRRIYKDILAGRWQDHDAFDLDGRVDAQADLYDRPNQASVFRSFQGWLSMSDTGPGEGTLRVYPDVQLSNSYLILRPFFTLVDPQGDVWDKANWKFDVSTPEFPGIIPHADGTYHGPRLTDASHPNLRTGSAMISVPRVAPGDMVFWHSDLVHSVEEDHTGPGDSSVMYIAAVPSTPQNLAYIVRQRDAFVQGRTPPDYGKGGSEAWVKGVGTEADVVDPVSRRAMGFDL